MKRLLPLLLAVFLLTSCAGQNTTSSSSADHDAADSSLPTVQTFEPIVTDDPPSEELLFQMFDGHPRYRNYDVLDWTVAEDGEYNLLGIVLYEDPDELYCYYMAYVLRDRIRPIAIGSEESPMRGEVSETTYLGHGRFSFRYEDYNTGTTYLYYPSFGLTDGEMMVDLKVEEVTATDGDVSVDSSSVSNEET